MCKEQPETVEDPWRQLDSKDAYPMGLPGSGLCGQKERREPPSTSTVLGTKLRADMDTAPFSQAGWCCFFFQGNLMLRKTTSLAHNQIPWLC